MPLQLSALTQQLDSGATGDETLVDLARQGDEGAIRALIKRHNRLLFRVARGIMRNDAEAEDVVQETYVRAFTSLKTFRGEAKLSTWLTRIALNEALGRVRRRRRLVELAELDAANDMNQGCVIMFPSSVTTASPETEAARSHIRHVLERAVDQLPDPFRMVFILRDIEGLSTRETAIHLSIRPETVKTRLHRARKLMRAALEETLSAAFGDLFPFDGARCSDVAARVVERLRQSRDI